MLGQVDGSFRFMVNASQIITISIRAPIIEITDPTEEIVFHVV